jgi:hypothetical protein
VCCYKKNIVYRLAIKIKCRAQIGVKWMGKNIYFNSISSVYSHTAQHSGSQSIIFRASSFLLSTSLM